MVIGAWQLHHAHPGLGSRVLAAGTGLEVAGAVGDMLGHLRGGESPAAFASIGAGFVTATVGVVIAHSSKPDRRVAGGPHTRRRE